MVGDDDHQSLLVHPLLPKLVDDLAHDGVCILGLEDVLLVRLTDEPDVVTPSPAVSSRRSARPGLATFGADLPRVVGV
jgi:hypothetical protein